MFQGEQCGMRTKEEEYHTLQQQSQQLESELNGLRDQKVRYDLNCLVTKPTKVSVRPAKTQISLGIRPVWSESLLALSG